MINMRRIQEESPLELVEMLVTFVCCLKDSCEISPLLLADFRSCHGYLFLSDLLLMLGDMKGDEAREACRNVVLLVASIVMIGHVALRPLVSIGAPFQDPQFLVPEPGGKGKHAHTSHVTNSHNHPRDFYFHYEQTTENLLLTLSLLSSKSTFSQPFKEKMHK